MKRNGEKKQFDKKNLIITIVLWTLGALAVLFILLWDFIFQNKPLFNGNSGFAALGEWFKAH